MRPPEDSNQLLMVNVYAAMRYNFCAIVVSAIQVRIQAKARKFLRLLGGHLVAYLSSNEICAQQLDDVLDAALAKTH